MEQTFLYTDVHNALIYTHCLAREPELPLQRY